MLLEYRANNKQTNQEKASAAGSLARQSKSPGRQKAQIASVSFSEERILMSGFL
jgi:hypothetical protein